MIHLKANGFQKKKTVKDDNTTETITIWKIKLKQDVEIWQLFFKRKEVINARWPSAQWNDDSVFDNEKWGHGYYNYNDVKDTLRDYDNGEIVDIPHNSINLFNWVNAQKSLDENFDLSGALINLNVGSFKSYTKIVNGQAIDDNNNIIRLSYDPVLYGKQKTLLLS